MQLPSPNFSDPPKAEGSPSSIPQIFSGPEQTDNDEQMHHLLDSFYALDGRMRMFLQRDGKFLGGSSAASDLLEMGHPFYLQHGAVHIAPRHYADQFQAALNVEAPSVHTFVVPCPAIDGHLIVRATSIWKSVVCLSLQKASEGIHPELPDLQELFGLTKAEASIVKDLFLGLTPHDIAADHKNSIFTVRAHIRRCYDKLEVSCREELWRKLHSYRIF